MFSLVFLGAQSCAAKGSASQLELTLATVVGSWSRGPTEKSAFRHHWLGHPLPNNLSNLSLQLLLLHSGGCKLEVMDEI